jgi:hypothetical protein
MLVFARRAGRIAQTDRRDEIADEFWLAAFDLISGRIILKNPAKVINHDVHQA